MEYPYSIRDVHISDPFILADPVSKRYYTYVQFVDSNRFPDVPKGRGYFYVLESEDLIHFSKPVVCFDAKKEHFWADLDYWAPELHIWKGKYYLISSFRAEGTVRKCQALVSDSPKGPFKPIADNALTPDDWQCLDGTLYVDKEGKPWLVFCHEWLQVNDGQICAVRISDDLSKPIGEPIILFRASDGPWVGKKGVGSLVTDGPFLYRMEDGSLAMLWSSFVSNGAYAVGYAKSLSGEIAGPWVQDIEPIYAFDGGHGMLFKTFEGKLMMSCHCPNTHQLKRILLFEMEDKDGRLNIINEITGNWICRAGGQAKDWRYDYDLPIE